jgi:hypothetical protein
MLDLTELMKRASLHQFTQSRKTVRMASHTDELIMRAVGARADGRPTPRSLQ